MDNLPPEVVVKIAGYLERGRDVLALSLSSKRYYSILESVGSIWNRQIEQLYSYWYAQTVWSHLLFFQNCNHSVYKLHSTIFLTPKLFHILKQAIYKWNSHQITFISVTIEQIGFSDLGTSADVYLSPKFKFLRQLRLKRNFTTGHFTSKDLIRNQ